MHSIFESVAEQIVTVFEKVNIIYYHGKRRVNMKRPKRRGRCAGGAGAFLAIAAFLGAVMCISFFSLKVLLFSIAVLFIVLGIFLLRL